MKRTKLPPSLRVATLAALLATGAWYGYDRAAEKTNSQSAHPLAVLPQIAPPEALPQLANTAPEGLPQTTTPSQSSALSASRSLFQAPRNVVGKPLDLASAEYLRTQIKGEHPLGRTADLEVASFARIAAAVEGESVQIPGFGGEVFEGVVNRVGANEDGWQRVGGTLSGEGEGTFSFSYNGTEANGLVQFSKARIAYQIARQENGRLQMVERALGDVVCLSMPKAPASGATNPVPTSNAPVAYPILNSRPTASAVAYLDFDGAVVTDVNWNGGSTINARASGFSRTQIIDTFRRVQEDYLPFDINITTDVERYRAVAPGKRMRCIITPTSFINAGGVALVGSFAGAGKYFEANTPCWVFNILTVKSCADSISHELGHTMGLYHDGFYSASTGYHDYFDGQGTGPTAWGPIMGAAFTKPVIQWSRGEYTGANRFEDDIEIIAGPLNGFGYALDDVGDTVATASPLGMSGDIVYQTGCIGRLKDFDTFSFAAHYGGTVNLVAAGLGAAVGNLDVRLDLLNSLGTVIASKKFTGSLGAALAVTVGPGFYYLRVRGTGDGDVTTTGYSLYGSRGRYSITGTLPR